MDSVVATAPGKVILFGEHAVVYGQPAIAVPLTAVQAMAVVIPQQTAYGLQIIAANLGRTITVFTQEREPEHALATAVRNLTRHFGAAIPPWQVRLSSTIPLASGLGSGAAATTALLRALGQAMSLPLEPATLNDLVYEIEKLYHGTPSGIDNTVVVYAQPVYFVRGQPLQTFTIGQPQHLLVADTGISSPTHAAVGDVRALYERAPEKLTPIFERIGVIATQAREGIAVGDAPLLGALMQENHALLRELTVSSLLLDRLVVVAEAAGAYGAKLSGGGRGGNMIALVPAEASDRVRRALLAAGARRVISTVLG